ncbi:MAG: DUF4386 domain-containing protein [Gammaproteobacteria bacterium]
MNSTKKTARIAGFIYLLLAITGVVSLLYFPRTFFVFGNATATANNITSSELLFRIAIFTSLISQVIFVFLVLALYRLLKEISHMQALLMVTLVVVSASTGFLNTLNQVAALILLSGADFLSVFEKPQLDALAYVFLRLHSQGWQAIQIFWGLWLFPFGFLVYKSRFIPRILGVLLTIAGSAYLLSSFMFFVLPQYKTTVSPLITLLEMGELPIILWLLIMGAKAQSLENPAPSAL